MRIRFIRKYKSIENFVENEIQDFSVFVGKNGAGKTHLLLAIKEGAVQVDSIENKDVSYFNFQTFLVRNQKSIAPRSLDDEKLQAWNILEQQRPSIKNIDDQIRSLVGEIEYPYAFTPSEESREGYKNMLAVLVTSIENLTGNNLRYRKLIKTAAFESGKFLSELTQSEFLKYSNYNPDDYELLESLSEVFIDYQKKLVVGGLPKKNGGEELTDEQIQKLSDLSPWNFINSMFREFGLPHTVTSPAFNASDLIWSHSIPFQVKLQFDGESVDFDDLSSGEKILCALAITVYQDNKSRFPKLLLLDEIDASLHPSMVKHLLSVISNIFIKNHCKVIFASHSPTTAALTPETSLFEVQKGKPSEKIKNISQVDAVTMLSEGFMTLEKGLKIFDEIFKKELTIISEGKNWEHIKKAIEVLSPDLLSKIQFYPHDSSSGEADLFGLFEFIKKTNVQQKILFVWDCDSINGVMKKVEDQNVLKFCFGKNASNAICQKGIENLFPENLFTPDLVKTTSVEEGGKTNTYTSFSENNKNRFLEKIKKETDPKIFSKFEPFLEKVKTLCDGSTQKS